jgi:hypothetical protein
VAEPVVNVTVAAVVELMVWDVSVAPATPESVNVVVPLIQSVPLPVRVSVAPTESSA